MYRLSLLLFVACLWSASNLVAANSVADASELPNIVVTVKPLQLIAAAVTAQPERVALLLDPNQSHHDYQLRPSERLLLARADVVFWVGPVLETFLRKPLAALGDSVAVVALHEGDEQGRAHDHAEDAHLWLDPQQGVAIARQMATVLGRLRPESAARFAANAERFAAQVDSMDRNIRQRFALVGDDARPYLVMHDAYGHFEQRYGLERAATYSETPEQQPGVRHMLALQRLFDEGRVGCVLREPQFRPSALDGMLADHPSVRVVDLDLMAAAIQPSSVAYIHFLRHFADQFLACVAP